MEFNELQRRLEQRLKAYSPRLLDDQALANSTFNGSGSDTSFSESCPDAAVLVALLEIDAEPAILLTQRAQHLRIHPGEIAFPGGKMDDEDEHLLATAVREAEEEVALPSRLFHSVGMLDQRVTRSNLRVTPCVGYLLQQPQLCANPDEIAAVFTVPVSFFLKPKNLLWDFVVYRGEPRYVAYYQYQHYRIWGMTAMVIVNLMNVLFDADFYPPALEEKS